MDNPNINGAPGGDVTQRLPGSSLHSPLPLDGNTTSIPLAQPTNREMAAVEPTESKMVKTVNVQPE
jgi:hypothetical protein